MISNRNSWERYLPQPADRLTLEEAYKMFPVDPDSPSFIEDVERFYEQCKPAIARMSNRGRGSVVTKVSTRILERLKRAQALVIEDYQARRKTL